MGGKLEEDDISCFRETPLSQSMCAFYPVIFYGIIGASFARNIPSKHFPSF